MPSSWALRLGQEHGLDGLGVGGLGDQPGDEIHGILQQDAGRLAGRRVAHDLAAGRVRRLGADAGQGQRTRVGPAGVAAFAPQKGRMVRRDWVQIGFGRELLSLPEDLVPAAAGQPLAGRRFGGAGGYALLGRSQGRHVHQIDLAQGQSVGEEMQMGVDEAGRDSASTQIDLASVSGEQPTHGFVGADAGDPLAGNGHGLDTGQSGIHGVDISIGQYQIGGHSFSLAFLKQNGIIGWVNSAVRLYHKL